MVLGKGFGGMSIVARKLTIQTSWFGDKFNSSLTIMFLEILTTP